MEQAQAGLARGVRHGESGLGVSGRDEVIASWFQATLGAEQETRLRDGGRERAKRDSSLH